MSESIEPVDQQLIQLLAEKSPEELSFEELDLLRDRLSVSPALRIALAQHLQTESYLTQVLGNAAISPDAIISRAQAEEAQRTAPWQWLAGTLLCMGLIAVLVAVFVNAMKVPEDIEVVTMPSREEAGPEQIPEPSPAPAPIEEKNDLQPVVENNNPELNAAPSTDNGEKTSPPVRAYSLLIPAERFANGNARVDNANFGNAANVVIHSGNEASTAVDYEFSLARAGKYYIHLRYAAPDSRPLKAQINHRKAKNDFAAEPTGGAYPAHQRWFVQESHEFKRGKNILRLARQGAFPHLNRIVISTESTLSDDTATPSDTTELAKVEPWEEALAQADPPTYLATAFNDFDTSKSLPQVSDLMKWFQTIPDKQRRIGETHTKVGKCGEFDGVFRLRWPWQENAALRLSLENHNRLRLHFYNGTSGVTIVYYQDEGYSWAAYATTRADEKTHEPATLRLCATDNGRSLRSEMRYGGPIDLRWHAGELLLSRGDIVLLRAPLSALPEEVFFDGRSAFHGIAVVPASDAPPAVQPIAEAASPAPASLDWHEQLTEGAKVIKHPDGAIELIGDNAKGSGFISASLGTRTPSEIVLEIEGASRGSGVYLTPAKTRSQFALRFANNTRYKPPQMCTVLRQDELRETDLGSAYEKVTLLSSSEKQYIRLLAGAGIVRHAISPDSSHWAAWEDPQPNLPGSTDLCLHYVSQEPNCRIKVNKISIRPLPQLAALAGELIAKVPVLTQTQTPNIGLWLAEVTSSQPAGMNSSDWRRACAVRSLAAGCDADLGTKLVQLLLDDAEARNLPVAQLLALYEEAFQLLETRHNPAVAQQCWSRYLAAAPRAEREGLPAFDTVRRPMMTSPVSWRHNLPVGDEQAVRLQLLQLAYGAKWEELLAFCNRLRFYQQHQRQPLVDWAEATAARQLPGRAGADNSIARLRSTWRQPLVEELSKDAYNMLAEMQAILDSDAFDDAARMVTSVSPDAISGVAPHAKDRQLLVSLPSAIRLAVRDYPELQKVMNDKFGPLAELRVRQSINSNNTAAVELAAVQFESTEAAAEAHRWLGDRALSSGQFARATAEYQRALRTASSTLRYDLLARRRLAAAMQGESEGEPVTRPITFGEVTMPPAEFEAIVADMKSANASGNTQQIVSADTQRFYPAPAVSGFEANPRGRLDGPTGNDPNAEVTRDISALRVNWAERQLSTLVDGNTLYVTNRFQLAAYNLDNGQRMWQAAMPGNALRARDWSLIPMRPLIVGNTIYTRMLYNAGPMLGAFEKGTGKLLWTTEQRQNEYIISDPLQIQNQLVALTLVRNEQAQSTLRLTTFDRDSGEPIAQHNLARLNEVWWTRRLAEVTPIDDGLVATLGGLTLCCDVNGHVRWIRRPLALPPEEESSWVRQVVERPLVSEGRLYLAQPSVRTVECIEPDTGRLVWSHLLPKVESILGLLEGRLLVRTEQHFVALDTQTGKELWRHPHGEVFEAVLLGGAGGMVYFDRVPTKANKDRFSPRAVWIDPATGKPNGAFTMHTLDDPLPHLGPLVAYQNRIWTFWGRGQTDPTRDLVELTPKSDPSFTPSMFTGTADVWSQQTEASLRLPAQALFPDWALLSGGTNGESGAKDGIFGENEVLGICVRPGQPTVFARDIAPAAGTNPRLRMRFNHRTDQDWVVQLSVQFGGQTIWTQAFSKGDAPQLWKDLEVDLTPLAGKTGTLVVRADFQSPGGEIPTWWKRLEFTP